MDQASRASRLFDNSKFKSLRQAARAIGVARSTVSDRRVGVQPQQQQRQPHARLERKQVEVLVQYIKDTQLQYAPVNTTQLAVVAQALVR